MSTQTWQPQSAQPSAPNQPAVSGPQGHWTPPVASPVQAQGMSQPPFPAPSSTVPPPSPSNAAPPFRVPSPSSLDSTSTQPSQPATPPPANLGQPNSNSTRPVSGYPPPPTSYPVPRWQPPPPVLTPAGPAAIQASRGLTGAVAPPGPPWITVRPVSPGIASGLSTVSGPPGIPSSQESSTSNVPSPIPPGTLHPSVANPPPSPVGPSTSASSVSVSPVVSGPSSYTSSIPLGSLGLSGPSVLPGTPGLPGLSRPPSLLHSTPSATFGFTQPSISPGLGTPSGLLSSPGPSRITPSSVAPPGISESAGQASSSLPPPPPPPPPIALRLEATAQTASIVSSDGPPAAVASSSQLSDSLGVSNSSSDSTGLQVNSDSGPKPAISSANSVSMASPSGPVMPPLEPVSSAIPVSTPSTAGLAVPPVMQPISSGIPVSTPMAAVPPVPPVVQPLQYGPYLSVPPVPQMLPWQVHPRPFFPLPMSIRPVIPPQAGIAIPSRPLLANTVALAPPGEQASSHAAILKSSTNNVGSIVAPISSSLSVNGLATSTGSVLKSNLTVQLSVSALPTVSTDTKNAAEAGRKSEVPLKDEVVDAWTAHKTAEGTLYYYNSITGQSTYEKPSGFQGEVDKVTAQPTPVSWEMVGGTGWALVTTNDGKKYYYHTVSQATSWQVPTEVAEFRKRLNEDMSSKLSLGLVPVAKPSSEKGPISFSLNVPGIGGREAPKAFVPAASSSALDLVKKKLQDSVSPGSGALASNLAGPATGEAQGGTDSMTKGPTTEGSKEKSKESVTERLSSDSSSDSEDEDRGPTKDECITQFKEMLKEKGIVPFSKWEKELPKIIFDPRFKAIPSHTERRSIFDHYVRTRAEEERKEKRAAQKAAIEGFKELLEEASKEINYKTDYTSFAKAWAGDPRFDALERKDRETLLHEKVLPLRRAEEERVRTIHAAAVAGFNAMLQERGEITTSSRWSRIKDSLRNDPRYRAVKREDREALFNAFVDELRAVEQEAERLAKAKREEEERLREREREMRKRKEREEQEVERVRVKARRKDAVNAYQALLTEKIKDPEASWTEARPKLEKDGLGRGTNPELDSADRERLFRDHVNALYERAAREYRALLADVITVDAASKQSEDGKNILTSWSEAKKLMKSDARYSKMPRRERESLWRRYAEDVQRRLKGSGFTTDERHPGTDSSKVGTLESTKHSPGHKRNSSRR